VRRAAARRRAPPLGAPDNHGVCPGTAGARGGGGGDPELRHDLRGRAPSGWRGDRGRARPVAAAARADPAVLPAVGDPRGVRTGHGGCCATCPRCRSTWWRAASAT
jgi:hypothetical protein